MEISSNDFQQDVRLDVSLACVSSFVFGSGCLVLTFGIAVSFVVFHGEKDAKPREEIASAASAAGARRAAPVPP